MSTLQDVITHNNPYAEIYLAAHEILNHVDAPDYSLHLTPKSNNRHHNNLSANEVAVIVPDSNTYAGDHRDILLALRSPGVRQDQSKSSTSHASSNLRLQCIHEGHPAYCPLHYVLLFPYGEAGWHWDLQLTSGKRMTLTQHTAFRLHDRQNEFSSILRGGRLLQHFIVDMFAAIDQNRLRWYSTHQSQFRLSHLQGMEDAINQGDESRDLHQVGQKVILPSSYTGGPRDLYQRYQDSMAIARHFKKIDIFLTITANPKWPEITRELRPGQSAEDRPDLIARIFKQKKDALMHLITRRGIFGRCLAHIEHIEFQMRGLPHCHILLSLEPSAQLSTPEAIDQVVWARWPDPNSQPSLFDKVKKYMLHGPCGKGYDESSPCLQNGVCRFGFPQPFQERTTLTNDGYPLYYRPNDGHAYEVNGFIYDNRWISTFNPFCLEFMDGHANINVAFNFWNNKYLFKYLKKGGDAGTVELADQNNEIKQYVEGRYFSAAEAAWRIFEFEIHGQYPSVMRLPIHLEDDQSFTFNPDDDTEIVLNQGRQTETALTAFFASNKDDSPIKEEARQHTYQDFPQYFTLHKNKEHKWWQKRIQQPALGRMVYVTPTAGERFYLRILLTVARGPQSFEDLRRYSRDCPPCDTFYEACVRRGLLENDGEWEECLREACDIRSGFSLRQLFSTLLLFSDPHYPGRLWKEFRHSICDDVPMQLHKLGIAQTDEEMVYDYGLYLLNQILQDSGKSLADFPGMPKPEYDWMSITTNRLITEQLDFNPEEERKLADSHIVSFNQEQCSAFNEIWGSISDEHGDPFFVNGPAGTGKTFLYNAICHRVRAESWIILCVASTGLAALLLPHGRTAHSTFNIPISDLAEDSICQISKESQCGDLMRKAKAILYDECLMNNKLCFEALDRTLRDIRNCPEKVYGGLTTIHGGDFQQILPVVVKGSRSDIVSACLQRSYLWDQMHIIRLRTNMRLDRSPEEEEFAKWLLDVGHGRCPVDEDGQITLPDSMVTEDPESFIVHIYGEMFNLPNPPHPNFFRDRAILAPRNTDVKETNDLILERMAGRELCYCSADYVLNDDGQTQEGYQSVPLEYLQTLEPPALPPAQLKIKEGCPLILLRNLSPSKGLCNGTRLILLRAERRVLEVQILGTDHDGEVALIPRICLIPSTEEGLTFQFKRKQFPVKLAFAMTINKAEGQSLKYVGLDLRVPVFSHGQLYVGLSRATSRNRVHVLLNPDSNNKTMNVVYPEVLLD